jgi:hypothetical protein
MPDNQTNEQTSSEEPVGYRLRHLDPESSPSPANTLSDESVEFLRAIPTCYYILAIVCGVVTLIFTVTVSNDLTAVQTGGMIGWTIGGVLGMLATGRLVELIQRISDDVRFMRDNTTEPDAPATDE